MAKRKKRRGGTKKNSDNILELSIAITVFI